jgi:hypothetical protein
MLSMFQAGFFSGIWCTPMVSSLCVKKCPQSQITCIDVSSFSPQSLQDTSLSGGFLLWSIMADCPRRNCSACDVPPDKGLQKKQTLFRSYCRSGRRSNPAGPLAYRKPSGVNHSAIHYVFCSLLKTFRVFTTSQPLVTFWPA